MTRPLTGTWLAAVATAVALSLAAPPRAAAQFTWSNAAGGSWNDPNNWSPSTGFPNATGATASFGSAASGSVNVTLAADVVVGGVTFDFLQAAGAYNIGSAGRTITFVSTSGGTGTAITVSPGSLGLVNPQRFVAGQTLQVADLGGLTVTNNGLTLLQFSGPVSLLNFAPLNVGGTGAVRFDPTTLSGMSTLTKTGTGVLTLSGAQTGFTGQTVVVNGGVVAIDHANSLGADPAAPVADIVTLGAIGPAAVGTLRLATPTTVALGANRGVRILNGGAFDVPAGGVLQLNGPLSGNGPVSPRPGRAPSPWPAAAACTTAT
jgi:autotransporter-associated beta strand protein